MQFANWRDASAIRIVAASLGIAAGLAGIEHGYFEILQGDVAPDGLMIASMGPPCDPDLIWNACEPAMTILPSFLITGILSIIISLAILGWCVWGLHRRRGGLVMIGLSVLLLLFGGGIFPPVIAMIGGLVANAIHTPLRWWRSRLSNGVVQLLAVLWPWPLVVFMGWTLAGQWIVGHFFNDFMVQNAWLVPLLVIGLLIAGVLSGYAWEARRKEAAA
jgi:hypothetical protein